MSAWPPPNCFEVELCDPFEIHVGPVFERVEQGGRRFFVRIDERHVNRRGVLHGGMFMTFADLALGAAALDAAGGSPSVTLGMHSQFLKTARLGEVVEVKPELMRRTRSLLFLRGDFAVAGEVVFAASSVWKLLGKA